MKKNFTNILGVAAKSALAVACLGFFAQANAQTAYMTHQGVPEGEEFIEIYRDTLEYQGPTTVTMETNIDEHSPVVLENNFKKNWFVFATVGAHTYLGEHSRLGKFAYTISPDVTIGVGKWFTPGVGAKIEFERSSSRGFTTNPKSLYGDGHPVYYDNGDFHYQRMKTNWWDLSVSGILNLSRLIMGYEGVDNNKLMNQFLFSLGVGIVHHMGFGEETRSDNELSAHLELQYSRFFTPAKAWSLDFKVRGLFYQTNQDLSYNAAHASKVDVNLGLAIGATYYLGGKRYRGWAKTPTTIYQTDYRERDVLVIRERDGVGNVASDGEIGTMTFYVFYPNNYSGRNDAPVVADAEVNTIDYLAGGLYTQKRYADTDAAASRLNAGRSLNGLATEDIPTELAENLTFAVDVPRGYEMSSTEPLSLSLAPADMEAFEAKEGFFYAPIYDGRHNWQYRIDDATKGQTLLSDANYAESQSFGLNAHAGLPIIRENMKVDGDEELVSFADVYAAINGNDGYIAQFTDPATVARIKNILNNGKITLIMTEGMATSQDNFTGADAAQVGLDRNNALSVNRAESVLKWLQQNRNLSQALTKSVMVDGVNSINKVTDKSTRGLDAKLNRGVKVRIQYVK